MGVILRVIQVWGSKYVAPLKVTLKSSNFVIFIYMIDEYQGSFLVTRARKRGKLNGAGSKPKINLQVILLKR